MALVFSGFGAAAAAQATPMHHEVIPTEAWDTLGEVDATGAAPEGYVGGRVFENDGRGGGQVLPLQDENGNPITYREWDIRPPAADGNRGLERIVTGTRGDAHDPNGSAFYTADHYYSFTQMRAFP